MQSGRVSRRPSSPFSLPDFMQFSFTRSKLCLIILSGFLLPLIMGFSPLLIDDINIVAIRDIQLRQEKGEYILDTTIVIRNSGTNTLKLADCAFDLALVVDNSQEISLGSTQKDEILLEREVNSSEEYTDTNVQLSITVGSDIQTLSQALLSNKEIALLLTQSTPTLHLHLQGRFDLGIKAERAWGYQQGIRIDWMVTPEIQREVLTNMITALTSGPVTALASSAETPDNKTEMSSVTETVTPEQPISAPGKLRTLTINFNSGSHSLNTKEQKNLREWAEKQQGHLDKVILYIEGHTDKSGTEKDNLKKSVQRALAVYLFLIETPGIKPDHVVIKGFGETRPLATDENKEAQAKNRRVEVYPEYK